MDHCFEYCPFTSFHRELGSGPGIWTFCAGTHPYLLLSETQTNYGQDIHVLLLSLRGYRLDVLPDVSDSPLPVHYWCLISLSSHQHDISWPPLCGQSYDPCLLTSVWYPGHFIKNRGWEETLLSGSQSFDGLSFLSHYSSYLFLPNWCKKFCFCWLLNIILLFN